MIWANVNDLLGERRQCSSGRNLFSMHQTCGSRAVRKGDCNSLGAHPRSAPYRRHGGHFARLTRRFDEKQPRQSLSTGSGDQPGLGSGWIPCEIDDGGLDGVDFPSHRKRCPNLVLCHSAWPPVAWLALAEAQHVKAAASRDHVSQAGDEIFVCRSKCVGACQRQLAGCEVRGADIPARIGGSPPLSPCGA